MVVALQRSALLRAAACAGAGALSLPRRWSAAAAAAPGDQLELVHVSLYFRHGARTPLFGMETAVVQGQSWSACGESARLSAAVDAGADAVLRLRSLGTAGAAPPPSAVDAKQRETVLPGGGRAGELTATGLAQGRSLGRRLRSRYGAALDIDDVDFWRSRVEARTTHVARCALTLRSVLLGLGAAAASDSGTPVAVDVLHSSRETLTPNLRACDRLAGFWDRVRAARQVAPPPVDAPGLASLLRKVPADNGFNFPAARVPLKDALIAIASAGGDLPWGVTLDELQALDDLAAADVAELLGVGAAAGDVDAKLDVLRLGAGPLCAELGDALRRATADDRPTLRLMSGHDTTVKPLLVALDIYDHKWPPFCACVALEVYRAPTGAHSVRVLYDGATADSCFGAPTDFYVAIDLQDLDAFLAKLDALALAGPDWRAACRCDDAPAAADSAATGGSSF